MAGIASQVILSVLASTFIGGILGWRFRGRHLRQQAEVVDEQWRERLRAVQRERHACQESLEESAVHITGLEADLKRTLDALKDRGATRGALERHVAELQEALKTARGAEALGLESRITELESLLRRQQKTLSSLRSDLIAAREAEQPGASRMRTLNGWIRRLEEQLRRPQARSRHGPDNGTHPATPSQDRAEPRANGTPGSGGQRGNPPPT
jgi:chromosome segregation ATPase